MTTTRTRIKEIIRNCCGGGASMAADLLHEEFVIIHRDELPETYPSDNKNGICAALAQEFYQPALRFHPSNGDEPGEWNRKIAYANLAVAEAVERKHEEAMQALRSEAYELYRASCLATDTLPAPDWNTAIEGPNVARDFLAIARTARKLHGKEI